MEAEKGKLTCSKKKKKRKKMEESDDVWIDDLGGARPKSPDDVFSKEEQKAIGNIYNYANKSSAHLTSKVHKKGKGTSEAKKRDKQLKIAAQALERVIKEKLYEPCGKKMDKVWDKFPDGCSCYPKLSNS